jgi:hypothetical protein
MFGSHLREGPLTWDVVNRQWQIHDSLGIQQFLTQALREPQWRLEWGGVESQVKEVGKASGGQHIG